MFVRTEDLYIAAKFVGVTVMLSTFVREMAGLNLGWVITYPYSGFVVFLCPTRLDPPFDHDHFLQNTSKFTS
jgi:hypothetical protein